MSVELSLAGRVALVVGGGGGGIGTAMVSTLAEAGADIGVVTMVPEHAQDSAERVAGAGRRSATAVVDVTDEAALVGAVDEITGQLGPIGHLVNVVGGNLADDWFRAAEFDMAAFDRVAGPQPALRRGLVPGGGPSR